MKFAFALVVLLIVPATVRAITIDTVLVGNPGNTGEVQAPAGIFGAVAANYLIAKTEVTNAQYVSFLNSVAATDPYGLYNSSMGFVSRGGIVRSGASGSYTYGVKADVPGEGPGGTTYTYGDKPVVFVSWYDSIRFANWVNNGGTVGAPTESGAYTLLGGTAVPTNGNSITRNSGVVWSLPSENQWYKAAYHKNDGVTAHYWDFPTASDSAPNNNLPSADTGNSANYYLADFTTHNESYPMTGVGKYTTSESAYGTFDQGGSVWEWTEALATSTTRVRRGGAFDTSSTTLAAAYREGFNPALEIDSVGFRLVKATDVAGDYNANGIVDAADYARWRLNLGTSVTLPNDATTGTELGDYGVWRSHFGQPPGSGSEVGGLSQSAIPEPTTSAILAIGVAFLKFVRRRHPA